MNKKSLLAVVGAYTLWGLLPLYWGALSEMDSIFILANRMCWSALSTFLLLAATKRLGALRDTLKDKNTMKFLVPAAVSITINWGVFIWAVSAGRVMDASLGYYMNPLVFFLYGVVLFKERSGWLEISSLALAAVGVLIATLQFGQFPFAAVIMAVSFTAYGTLKKLAHADGLISVCIETLLIAPLALLFIIFAPASAQSFAVATPLQIALLVFSGVVTAVPLVLYSVGVNSLPMITVGMVQFISPTLMFIIGILGGEPFNAAQGVSFGFIWAGLILFVAGMFVRERKRAKEAENVH